MKQICPFCEKLTNNYHVHTAEIMNIRGQNIPVQTEYLVCLTCTNSFDDPLSKYDPIKKAYEIYRTKNNYITPFELIEYRKRQALTQMDIAKLLNWELEIVQKFEDENMLQHEEQDLLLKKLIRNTNDSSI